MKRNTLTNAVLAGIGGVAGLAGIANAVNLNPDGLGEVLIYPYYTVNGGNDTLLSVVNTTNTVKAVKVRFVESKNSREVLDFNLYLSPFDVWVGVITDPDGDDSGLAALAVADNSCTVPTFFNPANTSGTLPNGLPFRNFSTLRFDEFAGVDTSAERTREGHFEMIEMGVVEETIDADITGLESAAIHVDGVPFDCPALNNAWVPGGVWNATGSRGADTDLRAPEGGLFGGAAIINVLGGTEVAYNADAIAAFYDPVDPLDTLHFEPGDELPDLTQADTGDGLTVESIVFDNGRIVTSAWSAAPIANTNAGGVDAVSAVYMHDQIFNEYAIDTALNGATEWVNTFPTKRFYVNSTLPIDPFTVIFDDTQIADGAACEPIGIGLYDREEGDPGVAPGQVNFSPFDPANPAVPQLCYEAQVVTWNEDLTTDPNSDILGSPNARNVSTVTVTGALFENGWAFIDFTSAVIAPDHTLVSSDGDTYSGLPVTGFSVVVVQNGTLTDAAGGSVLSNYAGLFNHRYSRSIVGS